jgi:dTDP-4-amino-4,6-dideoxygalactose transaminase
MQAVYANLDYKPEDLPVSNNLSKRIFSLPMHPYLTSDEVNLVIEKTREAYIR